MGKKSELEKVVTPEPDPVPTPEPVAPPAPVVKVKKP